MNAIHNLIFYIVLLLKLISHKKSNFITYQIFTFNNYSEKLNVDSNDLRVFRQEEQDWLSTKIFSVVIWPRWYTIRVFLHCMSGILILFDFFTAAKLAMVATTLGWPTADDHVTIKSTMTQLMAATVFAEFVRSKIEVSIHLTANSNKKLGRTEPLQ